MREFEPTEEGYILRLIEENTSQPEFGKITKVFEHSAAGDESNFEVNVKLRDADKERRRIPIATSPFMGAVAVPQEGDTVLVDFMDGEGEAPVVVGTLHNIEDRPPTGQAGIYRLRKGDLYFEMHPDGNWIRMAQKSDDKATPDSKIEIDQNGSVNLTGYTKSETDEGITASGDGTTGPFTLPHSLGKVPSTAHVQERSEAASETNYYVSNKTSSAIEITYNTAPPSGTDNLVFDVTTSE